MLSPVMAGGASKGRATDQDNRGRAPAERARRKRKRHMKKLLIAAAGLLALCAPSAAQDAAWPARAVSVVVPFAAGGTTDMFGRIFTSDMQAKYGKPFVVENKAGAGGTIGA